MFTRDCVKFSCFESLVDPRRPFANLQHCLLDTAAFYECLQNWIESLKLDLTGKGIHIDGKTARHSFDGASNLKAMHLVSAWVDELSICLGQVATDEKSNEITAVPLLLDMLEIKGAAVTLDAGCNFYRGQEPDSQRERASHHGRPAPFCTFFAQARHFVTKNQHAEKTTTRRAEYKDTRGPFSRDLELFQMRWPWTTP